ncbi:portal protein [Oricola cellulosilytica]|uniref:portal protein n=1 Tax=Oricola cellulosilytica TaxID=1429082 RepID=UPI0013049F6E|nr:portal protein [Oricola cellulosilytica]
MPADKPARNTKAVAKACASAYEDCRPQKQRVDELHEYVLPYRTPSGGKSGSTSGKVDRIFDSTATKAAFRFAGRMQQDVTPAFQRFFELKVGPYLNIDGDRKKAIEEELEVITKKIAAVLEGADFAVASGEMYLDLFAGTGAMLIIEDEHDIARFVSVPAAEIALREDGTGRVNGVYWKKEFRASDLPTLWPDPVFSDRLQSIIRDKPDHMVAIIQASEFNHKSRKWEFTAMCADQEDEAAIFAHDEKTCPWLTPRFYKVPGEAMGRGPGLMGLPTAKTLNKVTELTIKAAAFAILGLWAYRNDRVFNPKTAKMVPGAMWQVSATGGSMGASLQKLDVPGRFDVSNLILQDLRENVKTVMLDDTLPPDSGAVRSATEIVERMKRLSQDLSGAYARLILEIIRPLVQRLMDILHRRNLIEIDLDIDQLITRVEVVSPIAKLQQAQDVSSLVEWLQIIAGLGGQQMMMLTARIEDVFTDIGRKLGIPEKLMRSETEKKQIQNMIAEMIARQQQAAQPEQPPPQAQPAA